ncbi:hypothetical protein AB0H43_36565 [Hamadaea sp. NPDC050747]|uniref:DUF4097 family beta strand repeat-containing protein n=1 Tax=Hamadaea sp. NPDC050747 TaxID=3155789 RepID=UPI0033C00657
MPTFETPAPISASVDVILGDITFAAGDRTHTVVEVQPIDPTRPLDIQAADQVIIEYAEGKLQVKHPKLRTAFARRYGSVRVLVQLPTGSDVQGTTAEGEYVVQGVVGSCRLKNAIGDIRVEQATDVRLKTSGGRVTVGHVTGSADVTANGTVRVRRIDGDAEVTTIGGEIWIGEVGGELRADSSVGGISVDVAHAAVKAKTATGHIRVGELGSGPVDLYAAIGKLEVGVPAGTAVRLDAHTPTGRVRNLLDAADDQAGRTVKVRARCSGGGDVVVHRAGAPITPRG